MNEHSDSQERTVKQGGAPSDMHRRHDYIDDLVGWVAPIGRAILFVLFLFSLIALFYYLFWGYVPDFHSDSAVKNLLAEEIVRQKSYFPPDWNYVNGDLMVLFSQGFIAPFLLFFPNGFALHGVAGLISSAIFLCSLWWVSGMVLRSRWNRLLVVTIFAGGVHWVVAEHLLGQTAYGNVFFLSALTLYFSWRMLESVGSRVIVIWAVCLGLITMLSFLSNPQRAAAYNFVPLVVAVAMWLTGRGALFTWRPGARRWAVGPDLRRAVLLLILLIIAALIGVLLHGHVLGNLHNTPGAGAAKWLSFQGFLANAGFTLMGMLGTFGALPSEGGSVMSLGGAYQAVRFMAVLTLLILMPYAAATLLRGASSANRMFAGFASAGLVIFLFLQITTTVPDMTGPIITARYLVPWLVLGVLLVAGLAELRGVRSVVGCSAWIALLVLATSMIDPQNALARIYRGVPPAPHLVQAEELERRGLSYGYATYWNANVITVLSDGEVRTRSIQLVDGLPAPRRHLTSNEWYRPSAWDGPTFLMLSPDEMASLDIARLQEVAGNPIEVFHIGEMEVMVFSKNIAANLQEWDIEGPKKFSSAVPISARSRHEVGLFEMVDGLPVLRAESGSAGFLHFGPYMHLPEGSYELVVNIDAKSESEAGRLEVVADSGNLVLAQAPIKQINGQMSLLVPNPRDVDLAEVRVFTNGKGEMILRSIELRPQAKDSPASPGLRAQ